MKTLRKLVSLFVGIVLGHGNVFCMIESNGPRLSFMSYISYSVKDKQVDCFATVGRETAIHIWSLDKCEHVFETSCTFGKPTALIDFAIKEKMAVVWGTEEGIGLQYCGEKPISIIPLQENAHVCSFEKSDKHFWAGLSDGSLWEIDIETLKGKELKKSSSGKVSFLRYVGNNKLIVVFEKGKVKVFDLASNKWENYTSFSNTTIIGVEVISSNTVLLCLKSGYIMSWNFEKNSLEPKNSSTWQISTFFKWSNDTYVVGCVNGSIYFYCINESCIFELPKQHKAAIVSLFCYKENLVSASEDGLIKIWDIQQKKCKKTVCCIDNVLSFPKEKDDENNVFDFEL